MVDVLTAEEKIKESIQRNGSLHLILENEVRQTPFGQITFTVEIQNGVARIETLNCVKNIRRKYDGRQS